MKRTTTSLVIVWLAGATVAVCLGLLTVALVNGSKVRSVPSAAAPAPGTPGAAAAPNAASGEQATTGGTVYATCSAGVPALSASPAEGWQAGVSSDGTVVHLFDAASVLQVTADCSSGSPRFSVAGPYARNGEPGEDHAGHDHQEGQGGDD